MMSLSNGDIFPCDCSFVCGIDRSPVNSPPIRQWRGVLMFSLICSWINCWVNNLEAGDLKRHRAHYDVTVMVPVCMNGVHYLNDLDVNVHQPAQWTPVHCWHHPISNMAIPFVSAGYHFHRPTDEYMLWSEPMMSIVNESRTKYS